MRRHIRIAALIGLICALFSQAMASPAPIEVKWAELAPLINGYRVTLDLKDGSRVKGEVIAVRVNSIVLNIAFPGNGEVSRSSISVIHLERRRGGWGRGIGTAIGVMGGVVLGGYASLHTDSARAGIPVFLAISSGLTVSGYYAGRQLDKRVTHIRIAP